MSAGGGTYTLLPRIDLPEAVQRFGRLVRVGYAKDVNVLPFRLHERSEQPPAGLIMFIELESGAYWLRVGGDQQKNFHYCALPDPA